MSRPLAKRKRQRQRPPCKISTWKQLEDSPRDNIGGRTWWLQFNSPNEIVIANQRRGAPPTGTVSLTRAQLTRLARWFLTGV